MGNFTKKTMLGNASAFKIGTNSDKPWLCEKGSVTKSMHYGSQKIKLGIGYTFDLNKT